MCTYTVEYDDCYDRQCNVNLHTGLEEGNVHIIEIGKVAHKGSNRCSFNGLAGNRMCIGDM